MATKSKNNMGGILYNYFKSRNNAIKDFNKYHFNRNFDGTFAPRPGCEFSEPLPLIDWDEMINKANDMKPDDVQAIRTANAKLYAAYLSQLENEVYAMIDEQLKVTMPW